VKRFLQPGRERLDSVGAQVSGEVWTGKEAATTVLPSGMRFRGSCR